MDTSYSPVLDASSTFARSGLVAGRVMVFSGGLLNEDPDGLQVELVAGRGAFAGTGLAPTTIELTGDETQGATCGACVKIFTDLAPNGSGGLAEKDLYFATGGTLTVTRVDDVLEWTLSSATFQRVFTLPESEETVPAEDGCTTTIDRVTFSRAVDAF